MEPTQPPLGVIIPQPKPNYLKTIIFSVLMIFTVGLITYLVFQNQKLQQQILNPPISPTVQVLSTTPQTTSSISISPDETASWKTYKNTKFGFQFEYPLTSFELKTWEPVKNLSLSLSLLQVTNDMAPQKPEIGISVFENPDNKSIKDWVNTFSRSGQIFFANLKNLKDYQLSGKSGLSFETDNVIRVNYVVVPLNSRSVIGIYYTEIGSNISLLNETYNQILSTFKFLENKCPEGQYARQCKLGPCCCPNGAICD